MRVLAVVARAIQQSMTIPEIVLLIIFVLVVSVCGIYIARVRSRQSKVQPLVSESEVAKMEEETARLQQPPRARE